MQVTTTLTCLLASARTGHGRTHVLGVVFALFSLAPLAHASLPDPLWIPGIYDNADFDEIVATVVSATALVACSAISGPPAALQREAVPPAEVSPVTAAS